MTRPIETRYLARMNDGKGPDSKVEVWSSQFEVRPKSWYRLSAHGNYHNPFGWKTVFTHPPGFLTKEEALQDLARKADKSKMIADDAADRALLFYLKVMDCITSNSVTVVTPTEDSKP